MTIIVLSEQLLKRNTFFTSRAVVIMWRGGVVVITTACFLSAKPELSFSASSNPAHDVSEIRVGEDLWQRYRLEVRLNAFRRSTMQQKQSIIII